MMNISKENDTFFFTILSSSLYVQNQREISKLFLLIYLFNYLFYFTFVNNYKYIYMFLI